MSSDSAVTAWTIARGIILAVVILALIPVVFGVVSRIDPGAGGQSDRERCEEENAARERRGIDDPINC